ncbi:MAG TPA: LacI family DNA-binding transcriptional regulator, partial [Oleiagrimonas sp.]|nr:LacI family DNA-binding transcriptional regulator [Oleiagrimonas sp.]
MPKRKRSPHQSATVMDVAKQANVSAMTVSRVINGNPRVGEAMRERVLAAAKDLNYRPNLAGRLLRSSDIARIGVLYSNPSAAYLNQLMIGLLEESSLSSSQVTVEMCAGIRGQHAAMRRLLKASVDGVVLLPPLCDSVQAIRHLKDNGVSVVAFASEPPVDDVTSVRIDDYKAARAMMRHLFKLGHRRIALIKGEPTHTAATLRAQAYFDAMHEAGAEVPEGYVVDGKFTYRSGLTAATRLLQLPNRPTAIFCSNDDMAAAATAVAHGLNLDIPNDITITGFDDTPV